MADLILVIGPCGAGKTTYARKHYPACLHPDMEMLVHTLFATEEQFRYYPYVRTCGKLLLDTAVSHLLTKHVPVCLTISGATRKERAAYSDLAFDASKDVHCIRLVVDAATCIARAKADKARPVSARSSWQGIVEHWFRDFEPVDAAQEGFASYQEVAW